MKTFESQGLFHLENGQYLKDIQIAYHTYGELNTYKSNVIWICHALTANSDAADWWPNIIGENTLFDTQKDFVVCANVIGSCYGSTGPLSINPDTQQAYYHLFPEITIRDIVKSLQLLAKHLGIKNIQTIIGGSLGGQQALEWAIMEPSRFEHLILLATNAQHSPWGIAFNESQRLAIFADRTYYNADTSGGSKGLLAARSIALLSYRTYASYSNTQAENNFEKTKKFKAASYQKYQGEKLVKRFNAFSYVTLLNAMDSHNAGRRRNSTKEALGQIKANTLCIAIKSDILFPPVEQYFLSEHIKNARYAEIESAYGHDGFLIETKAIQNEIKKFYTNSQTYKKSYSAFD
jgi:homoserine O-acetyltransferase/O-succinyltransferase